jgi:hypothetical protein
VRICAKFAENAEIMKAFSAHLSARREPERPVHGIAGQEGRKMSDPRQMKKGRDCNNKKIAGPERY